MIALLTVAAPKILFVARACQARVRAASLYFVPAPSTETTQISTRSTARTPLYLPEPLYNIANSPSLERTAAG